MTELDDIKLNVPRTRHDSSAEVMRVYARRAIEFDREIAGFVLGIASHDLRPDPEGRRPSTSAWLRRAPPPPGWYRQGTRRRVALSTVPNCPGAATVDLGLPFHFNVLRLKTVDAEPVPAVFPRRPASEEWFYKGELYASYSQDLRFRASAGSGERVDQDD
jgi:hypothetical protein